MLKLFKALFVIVLLLFGLLIAASAIGYSLIVRSIPEYDADYSVEGVDFPLEIVRDQYAVPHIFGQQDRDVMFGLGFVHAQDRLWQMTMFRRSAMGRLAELFGERAIASDLLMRQLDLEGVAQQALAHQSPRTLEFLEAYAAGVNAWIRIVNDDALGRGAPEFFLFPAKIRSWTPADSLAVMNLLAFQLAGHADDELLRHALHSRLPMQRIFDLLPTDPLPPIASTEPSSQLQNGSQIDLQTRFGASNAWAVAPHMSASGGSLMAGDPHLQFTAPSRWMLARLELSTGDVIGATVPGMPIMPIGRSDHLGWTVTASYLDDQDIYIERIDPSDSERVLGPEGYKPMRSAWTTIAVADSDDRRFRLHWTDNGPILPVSWLSARQVTDEVMSLAWTGLAPGNRSMTAAIDLMMSRGVEEAIAATRDFRTPSLNLILADRQEIAMQVLGAAPQRRIQHETRGVMPAAGWKAANLWQGELPQTELPTVINPERGFVANTNNKTALLPYPRHVSHSWGDAQRIRRLETLIAAQDIHSPNSFSNMQLDTVSVTARTVLPLLFSGAWSLDRNLNPDQPADLRGQAVALLRNWSGIMDKDLPQPLIYAVWLQKLNISLIQDEVGPLMGALKDPSPEFIERVIRNIGGAAAWCDNRLTEPVETCDEIVVRSLDLALTDLADQFGSRPSDWRWGDVHKSVHRNPVLGQSPLFSWISDIVHASSGGTRTLNRSALSGRDTNPYEAVHGPGYRGIYDMAQPDKSLFVISTGQSGHPLSQHYDDLNRLWRQGRYAPMSLDLESARALSVGVTRIDPRGAGP